MDTYKIFLIGCVILVVGMIITLIVGAWRESWSFTVAGDPEDQSSHHSHHRINALRDDTW